MMKKLLCVFLMLAMILSVITACTPNNTPQETETDSTSDATDSEETSGEEQESESQEEETEEIPEPSSFLPLVLQGVSTVEIIYPVEYKNHELNTANTLASYIKTQGGAKPEVKSDNDSIDATKMQILIGDTKYTEETMKSAALANGKYVIAQVENQLVINGGVGDALNHALHRIYRGIELYGMDPQANNLFLPDTVVGQGYAGALSDALFSFAGAAMTNFLECGDQSYMLYFEQMDVSQMYAYLSHLKENGFEEKEEPRAVLNNTNSLYSMYSDGKAMVTVFCTEHNSQGRVIVDPVATNGYYSYVNENTEKVCEPLFLQVGTGKGSGMCYIFRFSNGEFFIYDGGFDDSLKDYKSVQNCQRIVALLKQYAPNPQDIHIAGWLITHPHIDHIGALDYFCKNYVKDPTITLENILINNPADFVADQDTASEGLAKKVNNYRASLAKAVAEGTSLHKTHAGQILQFGDATLEILYTHEMRSPQTLYGSNNLSIVSRMTVAGQTFMITGDTHTHSNKVMEAMYTGSLKCDFYQTPHHGHGANTKTLASAVDPKWVLWPTTDDLFDERKSYNQNTYFFENSLRVEKHFIAASQTQVFNLPFDGTNYTVIPHTTIQ